MYKFITPLALKNTYTEFISDALLHKNTVNIQNWIKENIIIDNSKINKNLVNAFLAAEEDLLCSFFANGDIDNVKNLLQVFREGWNPTLQELEFKVIVKAIKNTINQITNEDRVIITEVIDNNFSDFSYHADNNIQDMWNEVHLLLGDNSLE